MKLFFISTKKLSILLVKNAKRSSVLLILSRVIFIKHIMKICRSKRGRLKDEGRECVGGVD